MKMANNNSNRKLVPEAQGALEKFKYEVASEVGVNLKNGYNGDLSSRDAGRIGGNMVKKMIHQAFNAFSIRELRFTRLSISGAVLFIPLGNPSPKSAFIRWIFVLRPLMSPAAKASCTSLS